jgi:hypothetical protein
VLKNFDGNIWDAAEIRLVVKFTVVGVARRSWPAGGSEGSIIDEEDNFWVWESPVTYRWQKVPKV